MKKHRNIPIFNYLQVRSWSLNFSFGNWRYSHILFELAIGQWLRKCDNGVCNQVSTYLGGIFISSAVLSLRVAMYCSNSITWCPSTSSKCENWNFYSIYCEDYGPLECSTMYSGIYLPVFWRKFLPPPSKSKVDLALSMWIHPDALYTNKNYLYL